MTVSGPLLPSTKWSVVRRNELAKRVWEGETVVYDPLPGSTHLLDPIASAVFDCLMDRNASAGAIAELLAPDFDPGAEEDVLEAVLGALAKLRAADLIQPSAP